MQDFNICPYTDIYFGKNQFDNFFNALKEKGFKNIMLLYGKNSIKQSGLYDRVTNKLNELGIKYTDFAGIDPNPRNTSVRDAAKVCKEKAIDFILAVGGGSIIDAAKAISVAAKTEDDISDIMLKGIKIKDSLPIGDILTLAATGSESNSGFVVTHSEFNQKTGYSGRTTRPVIALLDPQNTYTVGKYQTAAGSCDILAHIMEQYFSSIEDFDVTDGVLEGLARAVVKYTPVALKEPENYEARANLMWSSTMALNYMGGAGRVFEGSMHMMEHALSAFFDITHGVGLAIVYPKYLEYILDKENAPRIAKFFKRVFDITENDDMAAAKEGIKKLYSFFASLGIPMTLKETGIPADKLDEIAGSIFDQFGSLGRLKKLTKEDVVNIYKLSH